MRLSNCKHPCLSCPFRKDSLNSWLGEERMTEIIESTSFVCHKDNSLQCAGHMILNKDSNEFVKLAKAMNIKTGLKGHKLIFNSKDECINHHKI